MRKSRFTDSQILAILKQAEGGVPPLWQDSCHPQFFTRVAVKDTRDEPLFT